MHRSGLSWNRVVIVLSAFVLALTSAACSGQNPAPAQVEANAAAAVAPQATVVQATAPVAPPTVAPTAAPTPPPQPTAATDSQLATALFITQQTTVTTDLSADGYNWSQANPILIDAYDHLILPAQRDNARTKLNTFIFSNDGGETWQDNVDRGEEYIERGMAAYDARSDVIHMLWIGVNAPDGVFYRRYTPVRDGDNKITAIERTEDVNLVLDYQTDGAMQYQHPLLLHLDDPAYGKYGALLAVWSARNNNEGGGNEIRAGMAVLGDDPNGGGVAANWRAPTGAGDSTIGNATQVPSSVLLSNKEAGIPYPSVVRTRGDATANDVYLFYHDGGVVGNWAFKRMRWNAEANDWSAGLTDETVIAKRERSGIDTGYTLKQQLGSKPVEDAVNGRIYFGFATWKSDEDGDTWSFVALDTANNDALSEIVDVYSSGGAHSYAPTGDLTFDEPTGRLVVSYITTGEQHPYVQMYDHLTPLGEPILAMDDAPADIPLLPLQTRYGDPARLLMVFRDTINTPNAPYKGWVGWLVWE